LAFVFSNSRVQPDQWPYNVLWRAMAQPKPTDRWAAATAAL